MVSEIIVWELKPHSGESVKESLVSAAELFTQDEVKMFHISLISHKTLTEKQANGASLDISVQISELCF